MIPSLTAVLCVLQEYTARKPTARGNRPRVTAAEIAEGRALVRMRSEGPWPAGMLERVWGSPPTRAEYMNTVRASRRPVVSLILRVFPWMKNWGGLM